MKRQRPEERVAFPNSSESSWTTPARPGPLSVSRPRPSCAPSAQRRRSASITSTCAREGSARAAARLMVVVVFPSPGAALETARTGVFPEGLSRSTAWRRVRYGSASQDSGRRTLTRWSSGSSTRMPLKSDRGAPASRPGARCRGPKARCLLRRGQARARSPPGRERRGGCAGQHRAECGCRECWRAPGPG